MTPQPEPDELKRWHRRFGVECNNQAWALAAKSGRSPDEDRDMLQQAFASAWHWSKAGTALNGARADVTIAHVLSLLGHGSLALEHARRSLAYLEAHPAEDWDLAFAHAEIAHAAAVLGDGALHANHFALAKQLGAAIAEDEDRQVFESELARIPQRVTPR